MKKIGLATAVALSLSACAGGMNTGTSTGNQNNMVTSYPVEAAMLNIYTKERSQKMVAVVDNQNVSADIKVTPKGSMTFNNKKVQGAEISTINKANNQVISQSVSINYFTLAPLVFHGFTSNSGEYSLASQNTTIPKMAKVGDSSPLITEDVYEDSSKRQKIGSYRQSWSLARDTNNTAWFCINSSDNELANTEREGTAAECYKINAKGDILATKLTLDLPANNGIAAKQINFSSQ